MLNLAKVAILAVSNQIGNCTGFQLIFGGGTRRRLICNIWYTYYQVGILRLLEAYLSSSHQAKNKNLPTP